MNSKNFISLIVFISFKSLNPIWLVKQLKYFLLLKIKIFQFFTDLIWVGNCFKRLFWSIFKRLCESLRIQIHTRCQKSHVTWYCESLQPFASNCCRSHCYNRSRSHNSAAPQRPPFHPPHDTTHSVVNALITRPNDIRRLRPDSYTSTSTKRDEQAASNMCSIKWCDSLKYYNHFHCCSC